MSVRSLTRRPNETHLHHFFAHWPIGYSDPELTSDMLVAQFPKLYFTMTSVTDVSITFRHSGSRLFKGYVPRLSEVRFHRNVVKRDDPSYPPHQKWN